MPEYIEREVTCKKCVHFDACKNLLKKSFPKVTDEEIDKVTSRQNDCRVFKPATDVVEVVRCKGCIHSSASGKEGGRDYVYCDFFGTFMTVEGYCHCGAKMDGKGEGQC